MSDRERRELLVIERNLLAEAPERPRCSARWAVPGDVNATTALRDGS
jgi:hypothetical protein